MSGPVDRIYWALRVRRDVVPYRQRDRIVSVVGPHGRIVVLEFGRECADERRKVIALGGIYARCENVEDALRAVSEAIRREPVDPLGRMRG